MLLAQIGGVGYVHVGSINGSETAAKMNRELALQARSTAAYDYLKAVFDWDWTTAPPPGPGLPDALSGLSHWEAQIRHKWALFSSSRP